MFRCVKILIVLAALINSFVLAVPAQAQNAVLPRFEETDCKAFKVIENAPGAIEGQDIVCGYLTVPEDRSQPGGKTIQLAILIIKSTDPEPESDPLVIAQGGPGGSGIDIFSSLASSSSEEGKLLRADRDLIIFEQRGTLYSKPFLNCPEIMETNLEYLEQRLAKQVEAQLQLDAYQACRQRLQNEGVNLAAYNSLENADDIADLAKALGFKQISYYGVSYGTQLGQQLMKRHPDLVRAAILDGVVSLSIHPNQKIPWSISRSFRATFEACERDADCHAHYPNLEQVFFDTVAALNKKPARIRLTDSDTQVSYRAYFDGDDLIELTTQLLYMTSAIPLIPKMIYDANQGIYDFPIRVLNMLVFDRTSADAMYMTVMCAESYDFRANELDVHDSYAQIIQNELSATDMILAVCADFNVPPLWETANTPVADDIPTLLFSGNFDPVTPPPYANDVAKTLTRRYSVVFPANGHGAFLDSECAAGIMQRFLRDPNTAPDTSCTQEPAAPVFFTPDNTLMAPGAIYLSNLTLKILDQGIAGDWEGALKAAAKTLLLPTLVIGLILFSPVIWLFTRLIDLLRNASSERRMLARFAPWLSAFLAGAVLLFVGLQLYQLAATIITSQDLQILIGAPRKYIWIYILPWIITGTSAVMVLLTVRSWREDYWDKSRRVLFSLATLAALAYVGMMAWVGFLSVVFY